MSPRLSDLLLSSQSDERLLGLARAGHDRAFVAIVERYRPELLALARRRSSDGRSEDIVQQAFLSAFAALRAGADVRHLRGWLYQIVRNAANRSQGPLCVPLDGIMASADPLEEVVQQRAVALSVLSELGRLPNRQREAMIGTALDGRARAEIASSMGLSEGAVRQLVHRARVTLRGAATALTPWPLARWVAAIRPDAPGTAELASGAGVASSGGLAIKLGALAASGTLLTGAAVVDLHRPPARHAAPRAAISGQPRAPVSPTRPVAVSPVSLLAPAVFQARRPSPAVTSGGTTRPLAHAGAVALRVDLHRGRRETTQAESSGRSGGQRVTDGAGGADRADRGRSGGGGRDGGGGGGGDGDGGGGGRAGNEGSSTHGSGSGAERPAGGQGDTQMVSASHPLDSVVDGSGTSHDSSIDGGSGSGSGGGGGGGSSSGMGDGGGGSGSGDGGGIPGD